MISRIRPQLATPDNFFKNDACKRMTPSTSVLVDILSVTSVGEIAKKANSKTA